MIDVKGPETQLAEEAHGHVGRHVLLHRPQDCPVGVVGTHSKQRPRARVVQLLVKRTAHKLN